MGQIIYRTLEKRDYSAIENLIDSSFDLHRYLIDGKTLTYMKHAYLQGCLAEQTYCRVAERDGSVIGVIMGKADKRYRMGSHAGAGLAALWYNLCMGAAARRSGYHVDEYQALHRIYRDFLNGRKEMYDGVLTLFAVRKDCRGMGVGTGLLDELQNYYHSCGVKKVYLYTDSSCNTGFYDSHGFVRAEENLWL